MRNFDDSFMPQRYRLPEKDTRRFWEKPEWWVEAVKWGIISVLLLGAVGFGIAFGTSKWKERKRRLEIAAQEARLKEYEEAKAREAREAREKAEREAREKARAEAKAERERAQQERRAEAERRKAERERRQQELAAREKGPARVYDLEQQQQTAGVRWWGKSDPPKFAARKEGDEYWCVYTDGREATMVRVKVGPDGKTPAAVDLADGKGFMRAYERELLDEAIAAKPHLVLMDRAAWVNIPPNMLQKAAHMPVPQNRLFRPAEALLGESLFQLVNSRFRSGGRLERLVFNVEFHWRNETHPPTAWKLKFDEFLDGSALTRAIEGVLQAELDAANAAQKKKSAAKANKSQHSLASRESQFAGGARAGRRLGENYRTLGGSSDRERNRDAANQSQPQQPVKERVTYDDIQRVIDEGYLSASFAE